MTIYKVHDFSLTACTIKIMWDNHFSHERADLTFSDFKFLEVKINYMQIIVALDTVIFLAKKAQGVHLYTFIFGHDSPRGPKKVTFHDLTFIKISTFHITNLTDMYVGQPCYYKKVSNVINKIYEYVFLLIFLDYS